LPPAIAQNVDAIQSAGDRKYVRGSIRWRRERQRVARIKAKEARRTKEALHRWTTDIVAHASELHIIAPPIQDNTKSGRGDAERNGAEVKTIAALNRRILSMAPASAVQMLDYKAKEAGVACLVERSDNHQISVGGDLRAAAIDARLAKRAIKRRERIMEAAE
jgi:putative transposase